MRVLACPRDPTHSKFSAGIKAYEVWTCDRLGDTDDRLETCDWEVVEDGYQCLECMYRNKDFGWELVWVEEEDVETDSDA